MTYKASLDAALETDDETGLAWSWSRRSCSRRWAGCAARRSTAGVSLVGPHRDDLVLTLGGLPAKGYASHGESWSFALALRLASYELLTPATRATRMGRR